MENTTKKYSKENRPAYAYTVLSHLVSQQKMKFAEMRDLLGISHNGNWYANLLAYIVNRIRNLKEEWNEPIPPITALVFKGNENSSEWVCKLLTKNPHKQPTPEQIKKVRKDVAAYDKWDKVLEEFRKDAFSN
jgi:hypothetical protein